MTKAPDVRILQHAADYIGARYGGTLAHHIISKAKEECRGVAAPLEPTPLEEKAFTITWREGAYYVSIPNYDGGKVVRLEDAAAVSKKLREELAQCMKDWAKAMNMFGQAQARITALEQEIAELKEKK